METQDVPPLPPKDPPGPDRHFPPTLNCTIRGACRDGTVLVWSILRGGFLGFGPLLVALLLGLDLLPSRSGTTGGWWLLVLAIYVVGALTYGWLRWLVSGRAWRRESRERAWVRWSRRTLAGLASIVILLAAFGYPLLGARGMALYDTTTQVIGRVVDARTGEPIQGATIYVLRSGTQENAEKDLAELRAFSAANPELAEADGSYGPFGGRTTTDGEGRFDMTLRLRHCGAFGPLVPREHPPPFHGVRMVLVERGGYVRTFFPTSTGTWRVLDPRGASGAYAVADARTLRLPPSD